MYKKLIGPLRFICLAGILTACSDGSDSPNNPCNGTETTPSRLLLQQLTDSGVIIKWRGAATAPRTTPHASRRS